LAKETTEGIRERRLSEQSRESPPKEGKNELKEENKRERHKDIEH